MGIRITPSILNADLSRLADEVARNPSADLVHLDVMDNRFVPNLTFGLPMVECIRAATEQPLDIHLMIAEVDRWAPGYAEAGAESVTFHVEASDAPVKLSRELRALGARASMGLRPATPIEPYADLLPELDMVLLMTVEPGFGGQKFLDLVLPKVTQLRGMVKGTGKQIWIQVDGGVSVETIERAADAGAEHDAEHVVAAGTPRHLTHQEGVDVVLDAHGHAEPRGQLVGQRETGPVGEHGGGRADDACVGVDHPGGADTRHRDRDPGLLRCGQDQCGGHVCHGGPALGRRRRSDAAREYRPVFVHQEHRNLRAADVDAGRRHPPLHLTRHDQPASKGTAASQLQIDGS